MGNTFSPWRLGVRSSQARNSRRGTHEPAAVIDGAQGDGAVVNAPASVVEFLAADRFTDQRFAQEQKFAMPFDLTGGAHTANAEEIGIVRLAQASCVAARRTLVVTRRRCLSQ